MEYTQIGYISKQHGLRGNLLLNLLSDYKISITKIKYLFVEIKASKVPFEICKIIFSKNQSYIIKFKNYNNRERTNQFISKNIFLEKKYVQKNDDELIKIINYKIIKNGTEIGEIKNFFIKKQIILFCQINNKEVYIPYVETFIKKIDHKKKKIYVELPNEILNIN